MNATTAIAGVDHSSAGAVYKGLATQNDRLYATDFHNARVDVFDASWNPVPLAATAFTDKAIPKGWGPFGIQALNGNIFVTYAMQDKAKHDDVAGGGLGYVVEYDPNGTLIATVASQGKKNAPLNAPWGLAMAPASFGVYSWRPARRQLRQRPDRRLPAGLGHALRLQGAAPDRERDADHDRRPLGTRVRQRLGRPG